MTGDSQSGFLVIGVGNSDRGDDGIGPAVISRLRGRLPAGVLAIECRGDLLGLIDEWKGLAGIVVIDAMAPRGRGGRIERLDLVGEPVAAEFAPSSTHAFGLAETIEIARSLNQLPRHLIAHLVEGERFGIGAPLSPAVAAVVDTVADRVLAELSRLAHLVRAELCENAQSRLRGLSEYVCPHVSRP